MRIGRAQHSTHRRNGHRDEHTCVIFLFCVFISVYHFSSSCCAVAADVVPKIANK